LSRGSLWIASQLSGIKKDFIWIKLNHYSRQIGIGEMKANREWRLLFTS